MAQEKDLNLEVLATLVQDTATNLGPHAVAVLVNHPDAVRAALAVAADALSAKGTDKEIAVIRGSEPHLVQKSETGRRIAERTRMGIREDLLTSEQFAARAGLKTRQSVHDWLKKGRIVGWQGAKRGYFFPAGQFDERGQPLKGLDRITPQFEDGYAAWRWLTAPLAALDGRSRLPFFARDKPHSLRLPQKGIFKATLREGRLRSWAPSPAAAFGPHRADVSSDSRESPRPAA